MTDAYESPNLGNITKPLTSLTRHGQVGWDKNGTLMHWKEDSGQRVSGTPIYDVRGGLCGLCKRNWELSTKSFEDQYYHSKWDRAVHRTCYVNHLALNEHNTLYDALCKAELKFSRLEEVPNRYLGPDDPWSTPWYRVRLKEHKSIMIVGRRKRVDHIEMDLPPDGLDEAFDGEDVTKGYEHSSKGGKIYCVHAWTEAKLAEYVAKIADALRAQEGKD